MFSWPVRVYYEDTDAGGVVYYANYLRFMERARTEWLRSFGVEQDLLRDEHSVIFVVRHVDLDYLAPARFNDHLEVTAKIVAQKRVALTFEQTIQRNDNGERKELCRGNVQIACLNVDSFRPCPIPDFIQTEMRSVC